ncbi:MAG: alanine dehydrogenase [Alphaproteobacteria bacterium]|nr:MAG: alanine dehydrogenase [Alphaproteobacteria bacterium]
MIIGVPKESKIHEYRVGLVPSSVKELTSRGHMVHVEASAGLGAGFADEDYKAVGAKVLSTAPDIWKIADLIVKVKEPLSHEYSLMRQEQVLFTYLHLAPDPQQAEALVRSGNIAIAYETITNHQGQLPLLAPMSEIAGRVSIQAAARSLECHQGGAGVLLGGVPGVSPGKVLIIGGGVVGVNAARIAVGMGAHVTVLDLSLPRLREIDSAFNGRVQTLYSNAHNLEMMLSQADVVVGAVLVPGGAAPKVIRRHMLSWLKRGTVLVDVAIDQGGCFETSRPTTHENPTYEVDGIIHYCVTNMPGAVAKTSAQALNNATLPFVLALANKGYAKALCDDEHFRNGLNVCCGHITHPLVAQDLQMPYVDPMTFLCEGVN